MTTQSEMAAAEKEVSKNYAYFKKMQPKLLDNHISDYALIHRQKLVAFFESENDAINTGVRDYGWGNFSVQSVRGKSVCIYGNSSIWASC